MAATLPAHRLWARCGVSVGMMLVLGGPAWSGPPEKEAKSEVEQIALDPTEIPDPGGPAGLVPTGVFLDEVEPNDTPSSAQVLPSTPVRVRSNLYRAPFVSGQHDVDVYKFTAAAGDRVYAATATGWSAGSADTHIDILDVDGTTVLETDDDDGAIGALASNVGGLVLTTGGTYYVQVRQNTITSLTGTIRPYDLYVQVVSGTPTPEVEPNNSPASATPLPTNGWVSGTVDPAADTEWFSLSANAGDTIVAILDVDPERDTPDWNARLGIGIFNNFFLVVNGSTTGDTQPSEAFFMTATATGTHYIYVDEAAAAGAPGFTYHLSVMVIPARARTCTTYTGVGGAIADLSTTDFTAAVPDIRTVDYLRLQLNATHPDLLDLDVSLISPDGNEVVLFDDRTNTAGATPPQLNLTIQDEAAVPMSSFAVYSGMSFQSELLLGRMEYFNGMQAQGTWTLRVRDDLTGDTGTVNAWSIDVCEPEPRPACEDPGPQEITVFSTDFEAGDAGFTHSGVEDEWERGLPAFAPITTAHSGTNAWKTDLDGTYNSTADFDLLSPSITLPSVDGRATLSWWHKFQMDTASNDTYWVEVREVGVPSNFRRVFSWTGPLQTRSVGSPAGTIPQSAGWGLRQVDISDFAGKDVEVEFHLASNVSTITNFAGVAVDDVTVTACTRVTGQIITDLAITKTDGQDTYFPGEELTYTMVASNAGPGAVVGALVRDAFPADLTAVAWTCSASAGSACGSASGTGDINTTVDLIVGGTATFTATATVAAGATAPIVNSAAILTPPAFNDPNLADNSASDTNVLATAEPQGIAVDTAGNGVYDPDETAVVAPTWMNTSPTALQLTGNLTNHTGPPGATYAIPDATADYGTIAAGGTASCTATGNCYSVSNTVTTRPQLHWDSTVDEAVPPTGATKTWTLHIGGSFTDVSTTGPFYRFIETLLHNSVTGGCTGTEYCPSSATTREQMAVFVLVSKEGAGYTPPACVSPNYFGDVPETSPFCRFIEELANRLVVTGCAPNLYCPTDPVTREQMAIFVLRTLDPTFTPPDCVAGSEVFGDMPASSPFCRWVEELARRGVVTGCGGGNYCPSDPVTREQMGVFLGVTFGLTLYGL